MVLSPFPILRDDDVLALANMSEVIAVIEKCLRAKQAGRLIAPPRHSISFGSSGSLVFTIGGISDMGSGGVAGFRAYETFTGAGIQRAQFVAAWDTVSGNFLGVVIGDMLGALRTGAIGGVAVKHLSRVDASICAVIGSGRQAETQLLAAAAVRRLALVRVYSRNPAKRDAFVRRVAAKVNLRVEPASEAREAVKDADIVLCATDSATPVIDTGWLSPGAHVNTVGPKLSSRHEMPLEIGSLAALIATDAPEQMRSLSEPFFLEKTPGWNDVRDLANIVGGGQYGREDRDISLFCSVGLAGTEVVVAEHLLRRAAT
ncbi:MAG: ornithine cyclodeaminase family protein [Proteobacteria bacterium]|nr:ornithine cyclodeaminase family protein [Pseudomonadota bacterium]MBI3499052.1 ornithine cyclodeaminase family protein [Pseudomonadota bacterium]